MSVSAQMYVYGIICRCISCCIHPHHLFGRCLKQCISVCLCAYIYMCTHMYYLRGKSVCVFMYNVLYTCVPIPAFPMYVPAASRLCWGSGRAVPSSCHRPTLRDTARGESESGCALSPSWRQ